MIVHVPDRSRLRAGDHPRAALFLDRDGVLMEDVHFARSAADVRVLPRTREALDAIARRVDSVSQLHAALNQTSKMHFVRIDTYLGRAATLLRTRAVSGLSFGYRARRFRQTPGGRELADIDLFEVSVVTHPLQHAARIHFTA